MCGIAGCIQFDGKPVDERLLRRACVALHHRGPDDSGVFVSGRRSDIESAQDGLRSVVGSDRSHVNQTMTTIGLASVRLAILDPTLAGHQPMRRDPWVIAYNGEMYNFRELRAELSDMGEEFQTGTDTEVLLAAWSRWGVDCLEKLNGMWAFAVWNERSGEMFVSRDPFGIKPLIVAQCRHLFAFASELDALRIVASSCSCLEDAGFDSDGVADLLTYGYFPQDATMLRRARRVRPGETWRIDSSLASPITAFDRPKILSDSWLGVRRSTDDYSDSSSRLRRLVGDAVVRQRVSDVPIGAFLSGGLDSSIVVWHLSQSLSSPVQTFCVGFGDSAFDERPFAREAARQFTTQHHEVLISDADAAAATVETLDRLAEPFGDSSIIPTAILSKFARQFVTVALSGDGGDELFGGYWRYMAHASLAAYERLPRWIRKRVLEPFARRLSSDRGGRVGGRVRQFRKLLRATDNDPFARHIAWSSILPLQAQTIFRDASILERRRLHMIDCARRWTDNLGDDPMGRILAFDLAYQLPSDMLTKVDLASMMHSLEARVPLLDPQLVRFCVGLPAHWKIHGGLRKQILIDAYRGTLPDFILDRPKKGFEVPLGRLLRGPLRSTWTDVVTKDRLQCFGDLSFDAAMFAFHQHQQGDDHSDFLFALLSLCWLSPRVKAGRPKPPCPAGAREHR